ncbi:hypothetical protein DASC09_001430 [Saccharomycopsis crataegensis]|uniref:Oligopeptide transporter n=1 Tax=Saccharomycopsis crataegensis TaxID=43959 RepID=A0AAV5QF47_9ASCO|nr:hypothetical protein DASC09_001430 [Saccharomycopsis crataegensis]
MVAEELVAWDKKPAIPQVTFRSIVAGLTIGSLVLISNFQFGLQTGWVSMMSLPSALLGFAVFRSLSNNLGYPFTDVENVFVQSISVSVGTGPLCFSFVGIIPAIEKFLTPEETGLGHSITFSIKDLIVWSTGLGFFGIFFAIPLRKQVVVKEKLPFPSGSATATLISVLHNTEINEQVPSFTSGTFSGEHNQGVKYRQTRLTESNLNTEEYEPQSTNNNDPDNRISRTTSNLLESQSLIELKQSEIYSKNLKNLVFTFSISSLYTVFSYFVPVIRSLPIFGHNMSVNHLWNFQPSPAYVGQGIIMGLPTVSYMLFGAILGWGILAPMVQHFGWADGPIGDWKTGAQGWILWISLSVMVSDSIVSFLSIVIKTCVNYLKSKQNKKNEYDDATQGLIDYRQQRGISSDEDERNATYHGQNQENLSDAAEIQQEEEFSDVDAKFLVSNTVTVTGIIISSIVCVISIKYLFKDISVYPIFWSIVLAFFLSILAVRALGETDLNPVSGIGKLSQLFIALLVSKSHPSRILINLVAGGIAEAGAQQAGDLMQDLKTGHLIGASPKCQFYAQLIGTVWSVILSSIMYKVYNLVYNIPNDLFRIPTAIIWLDCARLVTGQGLPDHVFEFAVVMAIIFGVIAILKNTIPPSHKHYGKLIWLPSGVPVGIGLYNIPSFTLARFIGGLVAYFWLKRHQKEGENRKVDMIIFSSGLVLGEGLFGIVNMIMANIDVPHL